MSTALQGTGVVWFVLAAVLLLILSGLGLWSLSRDADARIRTLENQLSAGGELSPRRAHLRIDNLQRQVTAIAKDIGWCDDRAHTKVITGKQERPPE